MMRILLIFLAIASASAAKAQDARSQLFHAHSLKCHFGAGTTTRWKGNGPNTAPAKDEQDVQFDSIDLKRRRARVIGNIGASDVDAIASPVGITFIESKQAVFGTTTVFAILAAPDEYLAVDSRHVLFMDTVAAEQYPGTCRVWQ